MTTTLLSSTTITFSFPTFHTTNAPPTRLQQTATSEEVLLVPCRRATKQAFPSAEKKLSVESFGETELGKQIQPLMYPLTPIYQIPMGSPGVSSASSLLLQPKAQLGSHEVTQLI
ncbi:hypothetical protein PAMA_001250 [Pampus argenteus]